MKKRFPDITIEGGGTVFLVRPHSDVAHTWLNDHISPESNWFGSALVVEHRYIVDLYRGMIADGLVVA